MYFLNSHEVFEPLYLIPITFQKGSGYALYLSIILSDPFNFLIFCKLVEKSCIA